MSGKQLLLTAFTGKDNLSIDIGLVMWVVSSLAFLFFMAFSLIVRGDHFQPIEWAGGLGALAMLHAGAQKVKQSTEPGG